MPFWTILLTTYDISNNQTFWFSPVVATAMEVTAAPAVTTATPKTMEMVVTVVMGPDNN